LPVLPPAAAGRLAALLHHLLFRHYGKTKKPCVDEEQATGSDLTIIALVSLYFCSADLPKRAKKGGFADGLQV